jgi:hypothetical protein
VKRAGKHLRRFSPSRKDNKSRPLFNGQAVFDESNTDNHEHSVKDDYIPNSTKISNTESFNDLRLLQLYFKEMGEISLFRKSLASATHSLVTASSEFKQPRSLRASTGARDWKGIVVQRLRVRSSRAGPAGPRGRINTCRP